MSSISSESSPLNAPTFTIDLKVLCDNLPMPVTNTLTQGRCQSFHRVIVFFDFAMIIIIILISHWRRRWWWWWWCRWRWMLYRLLDNGLETLLHPYSLGTTCRMMMLLLLLLNMIHVSYDNGEEYQEALSWRAYQRSNICCFVQWCWGGIVMRMTMMMTMIHRSHQVSHEAFKLAIPSSTQ